MAQIVVVRDYDVIVCVAGVGFIRTVLNIIVVPLHFNLGIRKIQAELFALRIEPGILRI